MTTLTINVDDKVKQKAQILSKKDGATLTFVINQFLKLYINNEIKFSLNKDEEEFLNLSNKLTNIAKEKINSQKLPSLVSQLKDV